MILFALLLYYTQAMFLFCTCIDPIPFFSGQAILNVEWNKRDTSEPKYSQVATVAAIHRCLPFTNLKKTKMVHLPCILKPVICVIISTLRPIYITATHHYVFKTEHSSIPHLYLTVMFLVHCLMRLSLCFVNYSWFNSVVSFHVYLPDCFLLVCLYMW